jgi:hypothetical protein
VKLEVAPVLALSGLVVAGGVVVYDSVRKRPASEAAIGDVAREAYLLSITAFAVGLSVAGLIAWGVKG